MTGGPGPHNCPDADSTPEFRLYAEPPYPDHTAFQLDRHRVVHSRAFRRLMHKTQVFVAGSGDHYRTRLTHSLEVAQITRFLARGLGAREDLAETIALAHDLGHPPFGHAGERALDAALAAFGGFDHNIQTLRIVTRLEQGFAGWDGLNLTLASLEGILKHNGPVSNTERVTQAGLVMVDMLLPARPAPPEARLAAIADDIAYIAHDIDDALRAGIITPDAVLALPLAGDMLREAMLEFPGITGSRLQGELQRRLVAFMARDVLENSRAATRSGPLDAASGAAAFSPALATLVQDLKSRMFSDIYRHADVMRRMREAEEMTAQLFAAYLVNPSELPERWQREYLTRPDDAEHCLRIVTDFVSGQTDIFAMAEHRRIFDAAPEFL